MTGTLNLVSYDRISADIERDQHGVESQARQNDRSAAANGGRIVARFIDPDISASDSIIYREGFEALIKALTLGHLDDGTRIDGLCIVEQSRLARNSTDWERWEKAFCSVPGRLYLVDGRRVDPYADDFVVVGGVQNLMDKMEVRKIKRRTRESHLDRAINGRPVGGTRPFGWLPDRLTLDPVESEWVKRAVTLFLEGRTIGSICRELTLAGVVTPAKNPWKPHALKQMISNPRLCGLRRLHGEIVLDPKTDQPVVGKWEPIITEQQWRAVESKIASRRRSSVDAQQYLVRKYLLAGLLRCGLCMTRLRSAHQRDSLGHLYVCAKADGGCGGIARNGTRVEAYVIPAVLAQLSRMDGSQEVAVFAQEAELADLVAKRQRFTTEWRAGHVSDDHYFEELPILEASIKKLRAAKEVVLDAAAQAAQLPTSPVEDWEAHDDLEWRRSVLFRALHSIVLLPVGKGFRIYDERSIRLVWR